MFAFVIRLLKLSMQKNIWQIRKKVQCVVADQIFPRIIF